MAKRLIDAEALKEKFILSDSGVVARSIIDDAPTVSAVEVVRCEKCKYFMKFNSDVLTVEKAIGTCYMRLVNSNDVQFQAVSADDYCSYGKAKEGDNGK